MAATLSSTEGIANGQRQDEEPVGRHDKDLVDAEAENQMDNHIEGEERYRQPQETAAAPAPEANDGEQEDDGLDDIAP